MIIIVIKTFEMLFSLNELKFLYARTFFAHNYIVFADFSSSNS